MRFADGAGRDKTSLQCVRWGCDRADRPSEPRCISRRNAEAASGRGSIRPRPAAARTPRSLLGRMDGGSQPTQGGATTRCRSPSLALGYGGNPRWGNSTANNSSTPSSPNHRWPTRAARSTYLPRQIGRPMPKLFLRCSLFYPSAPVRDVISWAILSVD